MTKVGRQQTVDEKGGATSLERERVALEDEYFVEHRLYPNVDFYSGIIYEGWLAHGRRGCSTRSRRKSPGPGSSRSGCRSDTCDLKLSGPRDGAPGVLVGDLSCAPSSRSLTPCRRSVR